MEEKGFVDTTMPFGLSLSSKKFTALADAVEWVLKEWGVKFAIHYLDDFLLVDGTDYTACAAQMITTLDTFEELGLPVAMNKLQGPTSCLTFLGFELDAGAMELRLPQTKLEELQREIQQWKHKDSCFRKGMESFVGKLAYIVTTMGQSQWLIQAIVKYAFVALVVFQFSFEYMSKGSITGWQTLSRECPSITNIRSSSQPGSNPNADNCLHCGP